MRKKINVLVNCPNPKDATSLYRGMGPLCELQRKNPEISLITFVNEYSWMIFSMADVFFLQRPYASSHLEMVQMAKDNKVPVWVDYDDDLFTVPVSNPAYRVYANEEVRRTVARIISMADYVTVSTNFLKNQLERGPAPLNKNIKVVPNALNERIFDYRTRPTGDRKKLIMWRGSTTHHKDLWHHLAPIVDSVNSDSTWTWLFQGDKPWFLFERLGENAIFADSIDPIQYFKQMHAMKPSTMVVPLHDCEFNRSKSNIAWLEAAFFGAMTIGPNWEEWQKPGCINYDSVDNFAGILKRLRLGEWDPTVESEKAWAYIQENLFLSKVNSLRLQVIEELIG